MTQERKILIVDDASFMRLMLKRAIGRAGDYTVLEAPDGETAIRLFGEQQPELVFLDISMPGMNGIEVLKQLKQNNSSVSVFMENGASDFIVKPFKEEQIVEAVRHAFSGREEEQ